MEFVQFATRTTEGVGLDGLYSYFSKLLWILLQEILPRGAFGGQAPTRMRTVLESTPENTRPKTKTVRLLFSFTLIAIEIAVVDGRPRFLLTKQAADPFAEKLKNR